MRFRHYLTTAATKKIPRSSSHDGGIAPGNTPLVCRLKCALHIVGAISSGQSATMQACFLEDGSFEVSCDPHIGSGSVEGPV